MTNNTRIITALLGLFLVNSYSFANQMPKSEPTTTHQNTIPNAIKNTTNEVSNSSSRDELQKIIDDFEAYVAGIPLHVRDEIKEYRVKIANINKEKRELYKKISQEAQNYLTKEQQYKKRILIHKKEQANNQEQATISDNNNVNKK